MKSWSGALDVDDFIARLVHYMGGQNSFEDGLSDSSNEEEIHDPVPALDWDRIGRKCLAKSRCVPVTGFMYVLSNLAMCMVS